MSFLGSEFIEEKEELYPDFFEPKPISPKRKFNIRRIQVIERRPEIQLSKSVSILGKRKLADAFGEEIYNDQERYGQKITPDFFKNNVGHGVY